MLLSLLALGTIAPAPLQTKVIGASLFKNGYAVVMREAAFSGSGQLLLSEVPNAVLGTLWITASAGVKMKSVVATTVETRTKMPAESLHDILLNNIGKTLTFQTSLQPKAIRAILKSYANELAIVSTDSGIIAIPRNLILAVTGDNSLVWQKSGRKSTQSYRLDVAATGPGKIYILSLERGMTWSPSYIVDISDPKRLEITGKATILNNLVDLEKLEVRLITGFPNMPLVGVPDPFSLNVNFDQFVNSLMQAGVQDRNLREAGFRGQMAQNFQAPGGFDDAFEISNLSGVQAEDLFFYRQPGVTLKKGDRGYFVLFAAQSEYEHLYEWTVADNVVDNTYRAPTELPVQNEIWHSLKFKNNSQQPWTTGAAITVKDNQILGQDQLRYTTAGTEAVLKITRALDVKAEATEEEVSRDKDTITIAGYSYVKVNLKGTLQIRNLKSESIKLRVKKEVSGTISSTQPTCEIKTIPKGLRSVNPQQCLIWEIDLEPGQKLDLTYNYNVLIRP